MAETIEPRLGLDRCERAIETFFALTLMELAEFELGHPNGHEWEVGRWPGFRLTLLAQPQWGPYRPPLAICPLPRQGDEVPFIVLITFGEGMSTAHSDNGGTSVSVFPLTAAEIRRDARFCAHRAFDLAVWLQLRHLQTRYVRFSREPLPMLPCMKTTMEIASRYTDPMSGIHTATTSTGLAYSSLPPTVGMFNVVGNNQSSMPHAAI